MVKPTRTQTLMAVAKVIAQRSTCSRASVGVVIAIHGRILATGYNGAPAGLEHCDHTNDPRAQGCTTATHAEANALSFAAKHGVKVDGAEMVCTHGPCLACAMLIINSGIREVVAGQAYRDPAGWKLLEKAGVVIVHG